MALPVQDSAVIPKPAPSVPITKLDFECNVLSDRTAVQHSRNFARASVQPGGQHPMGPGGVKVPVFVVGARQVVVSNGNVIDRGI
jgi:hypothetical protein